MLGDDYELSRRKTRTNQRVCILLIFEAYCHDWINYNYKYEDIQYILYIYTIYKENVSEDEMAVKPLYTYNKRLYLRDSY